MIEDEESLIRIAFHEAGHAVVAWRLGFRLLVVTVTDVEGIAKHLSRINFELNADLLPDEWLVLGKRVQVLLAGEMAEKQFFPEDSWRFDEFESAGDREKVRHFIAKVFPDAESAGLNWVNGLEGETVKIVADLGDLIEALAYELIDRQTMTGDSVKDFLNQFSGRRS